MSEFKGISVHDFGKPYEQYNCSHAYCNAHLIRELTFVYESQKQKWACKMIDLLFSIKEKVDQSKEDFLKKDESLAFIKLYEKIIKQGYKKNPSPKKQENEVVLKKRKSSLSYITNGYP
jgi:transposase